MGIREEDDFTGTTKDFFDFLSYSRQIESIAIKISDKLLGGENQDLLLSNNTNVFYEKFHSVVSDEYKDNLIKFILFSKYFYPQIYFYCYNIIYGEDRLVTEFDALFVDLDKKVNSFDPEDKTVYKEIKKHYDEEKEYLEFDTTIGKSLEKLLFILFLSEAGAGQNMIREKFVMDSNELGRFLDENSVFFINVHERISKIVKDQDPEACKQVIDSYGGYFTEVYQNILQNSEDPSNARKLYQNVGDYIRRKYHNNNGKLNITRKTRIDLALLRKEIEDPQSALTQKQRIELIKKNFLNDRTSYLGFYSEFLRIKNAVLGKVVLENYKKLLTFNSERLDDLSYADWVSEKRKINYELLKDELKELQEIVHSVYHSDNKGLVFPIVISEFCKNVQISEENFKILRYIAVFGGAGGYVAYSRLSRFFKAVEETLFVRKRLFKYGWSLSKTWAGWILLSAFFLILAYIYTKSNALVILMVLYLVIYANEKFSLKPFFRLPILRHGLSLFILILSLSNTTVLHFLQKFSGGQ